MKFHTAFDERWRQVATFRGSDANPKEQFVYHCAGNGGWGGSSYIDSVLLRDRDMTNGWTGAADGTLEERIYLLQNWRADVVAIVEPDGDGGATMVEWIKYSAYGVPFALPAGDTDSDGDCDSTDDTQVTTWKNAPAYDIRGDLDLDGDVDATDESLVAGAHQSLGRGVLTSTAVGNRKGYAGYEGDSKLSAKWHVRHRVLDSVLGRWLRRDPLVQLDRPIAIFEYCVGAPGAYLDPLGLEAWPSVFTLINCGDCVEIWTSAGCSWANGSTLEEAVDNCVSAMKSSAEARADAMSGCSGENCSEGQCCEKSSVTADAGELADAKAKIMASGFGVTGVNRRGQPTNPVNVYPERFDPYGKWTNGDPVIYVVSVGALGLGGLGAVTVEVCCSDCSKSEGCDGEPRTMAEEVTVGGILQQ
ncbi:MAG: hypothetical protein JNN27_00725 [Planctomycetes bacterium]|nr:hypothetical protein [Planctomycetota bacterium]